MLPWAVLSFELVCAALGCFELFLAFGVLDFFAALLYMFLCWIFLISIFWKSQSISLNKKVARFCLR